MLQPSGFEYFYGQQAESYTFYRIPKVMFTEERFKNLSCEAKVLNGLMLDRMSLSTKNGWMDEEGRVYIVFPLIDIRELIKCSKQTAVNLVHELDTEQGIGLIEKCRPGLGKANVFYVKNFMSPIEEKRDGDNENTSNREEGPGKPDFTKKSKNWTSGSLETRPQEVQKSLITAALLGTMSFPVCAYMDADSTAPALDRAIERVGAIVENTARAYECRSEILWEDRVPAVWNSPQMTRLARLCAAQTDCEVADAQPSLASEDFACYRTHVPSFFYWVGSTPEGEEPQDLHKPLFHTDDTMLRYAAELYMASVMVGGQS